LNSWLSFISLGNRVTLWNQKFHHKVSISPPVVQSPRHLSSARYGILTEVFVKIQAFWDVKLCQWLTSHGLLKVQTVYSVP
jgi:hypothetical protein